METERRTRLEYSQYDVQEIVLAAAQRSPARLRAGEPVEPNATRTTPSSDANMKMRSRLLNRSPNHRDAPIAMKTGASAPMIVAFATVVSRNALKESDTSAAKNTPPSAQTRIVLQEGLRPVTATATA